MHKELEDLKPFSMNTYGDTQIYAFEKTGLSFYIVSHPKSCYFITHPELVALDIPCALLPAASDFLAFSKMQNLLGPVNILYILRGGLNFPLEESCDLLKPALPTVSFISSERQPKGKNVLLDMKYKNLIPTANASVLIGDIIASGSTLSNAISVLADCYDDYGIAPKNIIVFTIGTIHALTTIQRIDAQLREKWSCFCGVIPVFYEGIFNVYDTAGITNQNTAGLDFYLADAFIVPQLRKSYHSYASAIFEKCAIYDGGDRRFNPSAHMKLICEYWNQLLIDGSYSVESFLREKMGYDSSISYNAWLKRNGYVACNFGFDLLDIYNREIEIMRQIVNSSFTDLCINRLQYLCRYFKNKAGYEHGRP